MVAAQGGRCDQPLSLESEKVITAESPGYVYEINCPSIGDAVILAGGGRRRGDETLNHRVGVQILVRIGDHVERGQPLVKIYENSGSMLTQANTWVKISEAPVASRSLVIETI